MQTRGETPFRLRILAPKTNAHTSPAHAERSLQTFLQP